MSAHTRLRLALARAALPLFAVQVSAALTFTTACQKRTLSTRLHEEAERAVREGRYDDAERTLARALSYDPRDRVAVERTLELRLSHQQYGHAELLLASLPEGMERTVGLQNMAVRVHAGYGDLDGAISGALALRARDSLSPVAQRELLAAVRQAVEASSSVAPTLTKLPDAWFEELTTELMARGLWERTATLLLHRPALLALPELQSPLKQRVFGHFQCHGWPLDDALLERLVPTLPTGPLEQLGRLEVLLRTGRASEAARLEPSRALLTEQWAPAWELRWARMFARRGDWHGVLSRTAQPAEPALDEARRRALRCAAQLKLHNRAAARAELEAWLAAQGPASFWGEALLLPELEPLAVELNQLREARTRR